MFPKYPNERTVFDNIMYTNLQTTIAGRNYPDEPVQTLGARFFKQQLIASELDGSIEPTQEYVASLTESLNDGNGPRWVGRLGDNTSFMFNIQLERSNAGYCYDGVDTGGTNVSISINGNPMATGENDTYYFPTLRDTTIHPPSPELWICRETFWELSLKDGLKYHETGEVPGSQA
jgi:hypothetical protein